MRVVVGDETGLLKSIALETEEQRVICSRKDAQSRTRGIQRMCWYQDETQDAHSKQAQVVIARANAVVEYYSAAHGKSALAAREPETSFAVPSGKCVGLDMLRQYGSVVHCTQSGEVCVKNTLSTGKPSTFQVGADVDRMRVEPLQQTHLAVGGKEHDLHIWSLERQEAVFKAKNVTHDKLDMRVPVWVKDLQFLAPGTSNGFRAVVGTAYHHVRIYDTQTKRRPVQQIEFGEYPINALCVSPDETSIFVADTTGCLDILDLRTLKHRGRCTGPDGALRDLACHPTLPYVAAVGLDRMVHVFNTTTRKYQHRIYAKQRLNTVLFCDEGVTAVAGGDADNERASKRRRGEREEPEVVEEEMVEDDEDDEDEEEIAYEGLEISEEEDGSEEEEDDEDSDDADQDM